MAAQERDLKIVLWFLVGFFVLIGGGWGWALWHVAGVRGEIELEQAAAKRQDDEARQIREEIAEFGRQGASEYYQRMLPDDETFRWVEMLRFLYEVERESGVVILSGGPDKQANQKARTRRSKSKHIEYFFKVNVTADFASLLRFVEGIEREVDRDRALGGGMLFEIKGIKRINMEKSAKELTEKQLDAVKRNLKDYEVKVSVYQLKAS